MTYRTGGVSSIFFPNASLLCVRHVDEEAQQLLTDYRDNRARKKMLDQKGIYKRYEIEWIGREGLSPDTHEEYLKDFTENL